MKTNGTSTKMNLSLRLLIGQQFGIAGASALNLGRGRPKLGTQLQQQISQNVID